MLKLNMDNYIKIQDRVNEYIGKSAPKLVIYSAYEDGKDGSAIDNLDECPIEGKVIFIRERDSFAIGLYQSEIFENPTWLEICGSANDSIIQTGDYHHIFLEGIYIERKEEDGVRIARLIMGS